MSQDLLYHGLISKEEDRYCALCVEFNIATEGETLDEAKKNLKEAVEGYLEVAMEMGEHAELIPRPAPESLIKEYEMSFQQALTQQTPTELYVFGEIVYV
ncbi:MAG: hypothetical protein O7E52_04500 [Candidatus Poribacteria bacterium]|nr:hypothetical protein [Candidatus Poribacteria bacterium]